MLSISSGYDTGYLLGEVAQGRESYYLDATTSGEPAGFWQGAGATALGLSGAVEADVMRAVYGKLLDPRDERFANAETRDQADRLGSAPRQYRTVEEILAQRLDELDHAPLPEEVAAIRAEVERAHRQAVMFIDCTFSAPKSVTLLHLAYSRAELDAQRNDDAMAAAEWGGKREAVEEAIHAGNAAMLAYLESKAGYTRAGNNASAMQYLPTTGFTVASFFQHTNRDLDPHLHIHNAVLNRVEGEDGKIRTLDSQGIYGWKIAAGFLGERVMQEQLSQTLGTEWLDRPDGNGQDVATIPSEITDLYSGRSKTISKKVRELKAELEEKFGRELSAYEMRCLRQSATLSTRKGKTHDGETREEELDRWDQRTHADMAGGLTAIARRHRDVEPARDDQWSESAVISMAVASVQEKRASWSRADLTAEILRALPANMGGLEVDQIIGTAERLTDQALVSAEVLQVAGHDLPVTVPADLQGKGGRSVFTAPNAARYVSVHHVSAEDALRRATVVRGRASAPVLAVKEWLAEHGEPLGADQAAAVEGIATSNAALTVLVGPAGAGKSTVAGALSALWSDTTGGRVIGLAVSELATAVLRDDGLPDAVNVASFLGAQERIAGGRAGESDRRWRLGPTDVLMIDEASMVGTADLDQVRRYADAAGARLVLTGDPAQLAAVEAGGVMSLLASGEAETYSLADVRRFDATWERDASLRLRDGDTEVLGEYRRRGRLMDAGTPDAARARVARAYVADRLEGASSVVVTSTNQEAALVSYNVREELVRLGRVASEGLTLGRDGNTAGVDDEVMCRRNAYDLGVTNRQRYRVTAVGDDGSLSVESLVDGIARTLPPEYVDADVTLAYAATVHAVQGVTVDRAHLIADGSLSRESVYVALTRGRQTNVAYAVTQTVDKDGRPLGEARAPGAVLSDALDRVSDNETATATAEAETDRLTSARTIGALIEESTRLAVRARLDRQLDRLTEDGLISEADRARFAADQGSEYLARVLRRVEQTGQDPEAALRAALEDSRGLADVVSVGQCLAARVERAGDTFTPGAQAMDVPAGLPADHTLYQQQLRQLADQRRQDLGALVVEQPPAWAVAALGPVPLEDEQRAEWERKAGLVAGHREQTDWTDERRSLGRVPGKDQTESRASWFAAWTALGRPEEIRDEQQLSHGQLLNRCRSWERSQGAAPDYVDQELGDANRRLLAARQDLALARAEGDEAATNAALGEVALQGAIVRHLSFAAEVRSDWAADTQEQREQARRAEMELRQRGEHAAGEEPDSKTSAAWWAELDVLDETADVVAQEPAAPVYGPQHHPLVVQAQAVAAKARAASVALADQRSQEAAYLDEEALEHDVYDDHRQRQEDAAALVALDFDAPTELA